MQRFQNILVGVDFTSPDAKGQTQVTAASQEALDCAIRLVRHGKGRLTAFTVFDSPPFIETLLEEQLVDKIPSPRELAAELLEQAVAQAKDSGVEVRPKFAIGVAWEEICRQVGSGKHDLVIVGTRELSRAKRFLVGSTGQKLLRNCPCPVWIARPRAEWGRLNILVPSDYSEVALDALRIAVNGVPLVDSEIHIVHALDGPIGPPPWYGHVPSQMVQDYIAEQHASAKKKLHDQLGQTHYRSLQHGVQVHVIEGRADEVILQAIDDFHIDLVVMGTSARSGMSSLALGNTTERLVSHMPCSLLAVKPRGFECPVKFEPESQTVLSAGTRRH